VEEENIVAMEKHKNEVYKTVKIIIISKITTQKSTRQSKKKN